MAGDDRGARSPGSGPPVYQPVSPHRRGTSSVWSGLSPSATTGADTPMAAMRIHRGARARASIRGRLRRGARSSPLTARRGSRLPSAFGAEGGRAEAPRSGPGRAGRCRARRRRRDTASHNGRRCPCPSSARERSGLTPPQLGQASSRRRRRTSPPPVVATSTSPAPRPSSPACEGASAVAPPPACTLPDGHRADLDRRGDRLQRGVGDRRRLLRRAGLVRWWTVRWTGLGLCLGPRRRGRRRGAGAGAGAGARARAPARGPAREPPEPAAGPAAPRAGAGADRVVLARDRQRRGHQAERLRSASRSGSAFVDS